LDEGIAATLVVVDNRQLSSELISDSSLVVVAQSPLAALVCTPILWRTPFGRD
jgi:hypothetical protein